MPQNTHCYCYCLRRLIYKSSQPQDQPVSSKVVRERMGWKPVCEARPYVALVTWFPTVQLQVQYSLVWIKFAGTTAFSIFFMYYFFNFRVIVVMATFLIVGGLLLKKVRRVSRQRGYQDLQPLKQMLQPYRALLLFQHVQTIYIIHYVLIRYICLFYVCTVHYPSRLGRYFCVTNFSLALYPFIDLQY